MVEEVAEQKPQRETIELQEGKNIIKIPRISGPERFFRDKRFMAEFETKTTTPTPEEFQQEIQRTLDEITAKGGRITGCLSEVVAHQEGWDKMTQLLIVEKDNNPPKTEAVLLPDVPDLEKAKKERDRRQWRSAHENPIVRDLLGLEKLGSALESEESWEKRAKEFLTHLSGTITGVIEAYTINPNNGEKNVKKFLLVEHKQNNDLPTPPSPSHSPTTN